MSGNYGASPALRALLGMDDKSIPGAARSTDTVVTRYDNLDPDAVRFGLGKFRDSRHSEWTIGPWDKTPDRIKRANDLVRDNEYSRRREYYGDAVDDAAIERVARIKGVSPARAWEAMRVSGKNTIATDDEIDTLDWETTGRDAEKAIVKRVSSVPVPRTKLVDGEIIRDDGRKIKTADTLTLPGRGTYWRDSEGAWRRANGWAADLNEMTELAKAHIRVATAQGDTAPIESARMRGLPGIHGTFGLGDLADISPVQARAVKADWEEQETRYHIEAMSRGLMRDMSDFWRAPDRVVMGLLPIGNSAEDLRMSAYVAQRVENMEKGEQQEGEGTPDAADPEGLAVEGKTSMDILADAWLARKMRDREVGVERWASINENVISMVGFWIDMAWGSRGVATAGGMTLRGGAALGKKALSKTAQKYLAKQISIYGKKKAVNIGLKVLKAGASGVVRTALNPISYAADRQGRMLPDAAVSLDKDGRIVREFIRGTGMSGSDAFWTTFADRWTEYFTEMAGGALGRGTRKVGRGVGSVLAKTLPSSVRARIGRTALANLWTKMRPMSSGGAFKSALGMMGIHSFLEEMEEEQLGRIIREALGVDLTTLQKMDPIAVRIMRMIPTADDLLTEAAVLAIPGAMHAAPRMLGSAAEYLASNRSKINSLTEPVPGFVTDLFARKSEADAKQRMIDMLKGASEKEELDSEEALLVSAFEGALGLAPGTDATENDVLKALETVFPIFQSLERIRNNREQIETRKSPVDVLLPDWGEMDPRIEALQQTHPHEIAALMAELDGDQAAVIAEWDKRAAARAVSRKDAEEAETEKEDPLSPAMDAENKAALEQTADTGVVPEPKQPQQDADSIPVTTAPVESDAQATPTATATQTDGAADTGGEPGVEPAGGGDIPTKLNVAYKRDSGVRIPRNVTGWKRGPYKTDEGLWVLYRADGGRAYTEQPQAKALPVVESISAADARTREEEPLLLWDGWVLRGDAYVRPDGDPDEIDAQATPTATATQTDGAADTGGEPGVEPAGGGDIPTELNVAYKPDMAVYDTQDVSGWKRKPYKNDWGEWVLYRADGGMAYTVEPQAEALPVVESYNAEGARALGEEQRLLDDGWVLRGDAYVRPGSDVEAAEGAAPIDLSAIFEPDQGADLQGPEGREEHTDIFDAVQQAVIANRSRVSPLDRKNERAYVFDDPAVEARANQETRFRNKKMQRREMLQKLWDSGYTKIGNAKKGSKFRLLKHPGQRISYRITEDDVTILRALQNERKKVNAAAPGDRYVFPDSDVEKASNQKAKRPSGRKMSRRKLIQTALMEGARVTRTPAGVVRLGSDHLPARAILLSKPDMVILTRILEDINDQNKQDRIADKAESDSTAAQRAETAWKAAERFRREETPLSDFVNQNPYIKWPQGHFAEELAPIRNRWRRNTKGQTYLEWDIVLELAKSAGLVHDDAKDPEELVDLYLQHKEIARRKWEADKDADAEMEYVATREFTRLFGDYIKAGYKPVDADSDDPLIRAIWAEALEFYDVDEASLIPAGDPVDENLYPWELNELLSSMADEYETTFRWHVEYAGTAAADEFMPADMQMDIVAIDETDAQALLPVEGFPDLPSANQAYFARTGLVSADAGTVLLQHPESGRFLRVGNEGDLEQAESYGFAVTSTDGDVSDVMPDISEGLAKQSTERTLEPDVSDTPEPKTEDQNERQQDTQEDRFEQAQDERGDGERNKDFNNEELGQLIGSLGFSEKTYKEVVDLLGSSELDHEEAQSAKFRRWDIRNKVLGVRKYAVQDLTKLIGATTFEGVTFVSAGELDSCYEHETFHSAASSKIESIAEAARKVISYIDQTSKTFRSYKNFLIDAYEIKGGMPDNFAAEDLAAEFSESGFEPHMDWQGKIYDLRDAITDTDKAAEAVRDLWKAIDAEVAKADTAESDDPKAAKTTKKQKRKTKRAAERKEEDAEATALWAELNSLASKMKLGVDPDIVIIGTKLAAVYIKKGMRNFRDFAAVAREHLGANWEKMKGQLLSFWQGAAELTDFGDIVDDIEDLTRKQAGRILNTVEKEAEEAEKTEEDTEDEGTKQSGNRNEEPGSGAVAPRPDENKGNDALVGGAGITEGRGGEGTAGTLPGFESMFGQGGADNGVPSETMGVAGQPASGGSGGSIRGNRADGVVSGAPGRDDSTVPQSANGPLNYSLEAKPAVQLTKGERRRINARVKELLDRGAPYDSSEKETLRQYTGEGGLSSGKVEALTQHYTGYDVIRAMFSALDAAGLKPRKVLEPSVGSGNFVGMRPGYTWTTIDIDPTNHAVTEALYPDAKNYLTSFEDFRSRNFNLIISNIPFLEQRTSSGKKTRPDVKMLHDFYFVHAMDLLAENGVIAFVTTRGSMDKKDESIRRELMEKGDLLGAFRLPSSTFEKNAHTSVITDIIFIQKRPEGAMPSAEQKAINDEFITASETKDGIVLNDYYHTRMDNMLGDVAVGKDKARFGRESYQVTGDADLGRIAIELNQYEKSSKPATEQIEKEGDIPRDSKDFAKWVDSHDVITRMSALKIKNSEGTEVELSGRDADMDKNIIEENGTYYAFDTAIEFSDIIGSAKIYRPAPYFVSRKLVVLQRIADLATEYQKTGDDSYKIRAVAEIDRYMHADPHPRKDKSLVRYMRKLGESSFLSELGSYFSDTGVPASVLRTRTRFTGSGKAAVTAKDPIKVRAFAAEDNTGSINLLESKYLSENDLDELLNLGYALAAHNKAAGNIVVQNEILYYSGNIYAKIVDAKDMLIRLNGQTRIEHHIESQMSRLEEIKPEPAGIDTMKFTGVESWLLPILRRAGIFSPEKRIDAERGEAYWRTGDGVFDSFLNKNQLVTRGDGEMEYMFLERVREAEEHVKDVITKLKDRIREQPAVLERVEHAYNSRFRNYVKPDYAKAEYLIRDILDEIEKNTGGTIELRKNQIEWIIQAVYEGRGINAHDVGGGKTMAAIVLARVMKVRGIAHKPIFVVPAKTIQKWQKETLMLFPDAVIINLGNLSKDKRTDALFELANQNADYVFISTEGFEKIKLSIETETEYIRAVVFENMDDDSLTGRAAARNQQMVDDFMRIVRERERDPRLTFEKLGIDMIVADEAHVYKNIGISSRLNKWGLGTNFGLKITDRIDRKTGSVSQTATIKSARSYDFRFKANWISRNNNKKNVFLLTATPTPNKPLEVYSMLRHLGSDIFEEYGIDTAKDFSDNFFRVGTVMDQSKNKAVNILRAIINAQSLRGILNRFVDKIAMEDMPHIIVPSAKEEKHILDSSEHFQEIADDLIRRIHNINQGPPPKAGDDTVIAVYTGGRSASVDPRLYGGAHAQVRIDTRTFDLETDKVEFVVDGVVNNFKANPAGGQLIFLDNAGHTAVQNGKMTENIHDEMKREIMERTGLKASEVGIINGLEVTHPGTGKDSNVSGMAKDKRKFDLSESYNAGKMKVLIGTTSSMGEGMDLQVKTTDIWHVDIPYTPGAFRQRNGRGVRFGNENKSVTIHYMFMAGTYDSLSYNMVVNKKGWNEAIWDKDVADEISTEEEMTSGGIPEREAILIEMERDPERKAQLIVQLRIKRLAREIDEASMGYQVASGKKGSTIFSIKIIDENRAKREEALAALKPDETIKDPAKRKAKYEKSKKHLQSLIESSDRQKKRALDHIASLEIKMERIGDVREKLEDYYKQIIRTFYNEKTGMVIPPDFLGQDSVDTYMGYNTTDAKGEEKEKSQRFRPRVAHRFFRRPARLSDIKKDHKKARPSSGGRWIARGDRGVGRTEPVVRNFRPVSGQAKVREETIPYSPRTEIDSTAVRDTIPNREQIKSFLERQGVPDEKQTDAVRETQEHFGFTTEAGRRRLQDSPRGTDVTSSGPGSVRSKTETASETGFSPIGISQRAKARLIKKAEAATKGFGESEWDAAFKILGPTTPVSALLPELIKARTPTAAEVYGMKIESQEDVRDLLAPLRNPYCRSYKVLWLDSQKRAMDLSICSVGTIRTGLINAQSVLRTRPDGAVSCYISRNEPNGNPVPKPDDITEGQKIIRSLNNAGLRVNDFIITNGTKFASLRGLDLLAPSFKTNDSIPDIQDTGAPDSSAIEGGGHRVSAAGNVLVTAADNPEYMAVNLDDPAVRSAWQMQTRGELFNVVQRFADKGQKATYAVYTTDENIVMGVNKFPPNYSREKQRRDIARSAPSLGASGVFLVSTGSDAGTFSMSELKSVAILRPGLNEGNIQLIDWVKIDDRSDGLFSLRYDGAKQFDWETNMVQEREGRRVSEREIRGFVDRQQIPQGYRDAAVRDLQAEFGFAKNITEGTSTKRRSKANVDMTPIKMSRTELLSLEKRKKASQEAFEQNRWREALNVLDPETPVSWVIPELIRAEMPTVAEYYGMEIADANDIHDLLAPLRSPYFESLKAVWLDKDNKVLSVDVVTVGIQDASLVDPGGIFRSRPQGATALIVSHNHPSGDPFPSSEDMQATRQIKEFAEMAGVALLDHVITNGTKYFSFNDHFGAEAPRYLTGPQGLRVATKEKPDISTAKGKHRISVTGRTLIPAENNASYHAYDHMAAAGGDASEAKYSIKSPGELSIFINNIVLDRKQAGTYIVMMNTKGRIVALSRFDDSKSPADIAKHILLNAPRAGALTFIIAAPIGQVKRDNHAKDIDTYVKDIDAYLEDAALIRDALGSSGVTMSDMLLLDMDDQTKPYMSLREERLFDVESIGTRDLDAVREGWEPLTRKDFDILEKENEFIVIKKGTSDISVAWPTGRVYFPDSSMEEAEQHIKNLIERNEERLRYRIDHGTVDAAYMDETRFRESPANYYYSPLARAVRGLKQDTFSIAQLKGVLGKTAGVKQEEIDDLGLYDWLDGVDAGKVTKDEVLRFIENGGPNLSVVEPGQETGTKYVLTTAFGETREFDNREEAAQAYEDEREWIEQEAIDFDEGDLSVTVSTAEGDVLFNAEMNEDGVWERIVDPRDRWGEQETFDNYGEAKAFAEDLAESERETLREMVDLQKNEDADDREYEDWTIRPGDPNSNYREILLTLPERQGEANFQSAHWNDTKNVLAHVRLIDMKGEKNERILFIEEIQSDWHQEGRREGYTGRIPDAPFKKSWALLAFKTVLRIAAEEGYRYYDAVAWTPGDVQAERYSLDHQVDYIERSESIRLLSDVYLNEPQLSSYEEKDYVLVIVHTSGGRDIQFFANKNDGKVYGSLMENSAILRDKTITEVLGKDLGQRILNDSGPKRYEGEDLKIGGEGMKGFYDKILPKMVDKYVRKSLDPASGVTVGRLQKGNLVRPSHPVAMAVANGDADMWMLPITETMQQKIMAGQSLYRRNNATSVPREITSEQIEELHELLSSWLGRSFDKLTIAKVVDRYGAEKAGAFIKPLREIVLNPERSDPRSTAMHEAVHFARELLLTPAENKEIDAAMKRLQWDEESLAEGIITYLKTGKLTKADITRLSPKGGKPAPLGIRHRMAALIRRFVDTLKGLIVGKSAELDKILAFYDSLSQGGLVQRGASPGVRDNAGGDIRYRNGSAEQLAFSDAEKTEEELKNEHIWDQEQRGVFKQLHAFLASRKEGRAISKDAKEKNKADIGVIENYLLSPLYYTEKIPAFRRAHQDILSAPDVRSEMESRLYTHPSERDSVGTVEPTNLAKVIKDFIVENNEEYKRVNKVLLALDQGKPVNRVGQIDNDPHRWGVFEVGGKRALLDNKEFETEREALDDMHSRQVSRLINSEQVSGDAREYILAVRTIADNIYEYLSQTLREFEDSLSAKYGEDLHGKTKVADIYAALAQMGDLRDTWVPRIHQTGKWHAFLTKEGFHTQRIAGDTRSFTARRVGKLERDGWEAITDKQTGAKVWKTDQPSDDSILTVRIAALQDLMSSAIGQLEGRDGTRKLKLDDFGYEAFEENYELAKGGTEPHLVIAGPRNPRLTELFMRFDGRYYDNHTGHGKAWVFKNNDLGLVKSLEEALTDFGMLDTSQIISQFRSIFVQEIADLIRARGSRARMIHRSKTGADDVVEGYETDVGKAIVRSVQSTAGGFAKLQTGRAFMEHIMGLDISLEAFARNNDLPLLTQSDKAEAYRKYHAFVLDRRIDSAKQPHAWSDAKNMYIDYMRNDEALDRIMGFLRGLTAMKYLSRISTGLVNMTALLTTVPAAALAYGKISPWRMVRNVKKVLKLYPVYILHNDLGGDTWATRQMKKLASGVNTEGKVSPEMQKIFDYIRKEGWHNAQLNREALALASTKMSASAQVVASHLMLVMSVTEEMNRVATIAGAYMDLRKQGVREEEAWETAKTVSDKAHGVYGKGNIMKIGRGAAGGQIARQLLMFKTFPLNMLTIMYRDMLGGGLSSLAKGETTDAKRLLNSFMWLQLSSLILAGPKTAAAYLVAKEIIRFLGGDPDEPEEAMYEWVYNTFGAKGEEVARYGVTSLAGINLSGSLNASVLDSSYHSGFRGAFETFGGAPASFVTETIDGVRMLLRGDFVRGAEMLLPATAAQGFRAYREAQGISNSRDMPLYFENERVAATAGETARRLLGFSSTRVQRMKDRNYSSFRLQRDFSAERSVIANAFRRNWMRPGSVDPESVQQAIKEYNDLADSSRLSKTLPRIDDKWIKNLRRRWEMAPKEQRIKANERNSTNRGNTR